MSAALTAGGSCKTQDPSLLGILCLSDVFLEAALTNQQGPRFTVDSHLDQLIIYFNNPLMHTFLRDDNLNH